jgi:hypothetical protein
MTDHAFLSAVRQDLKAILARVADYKAETDDGELARHGIRDLIAGAVDDAADELAMLDRAGEDEATRRYWAEHEADIAAANARAL